MRINKTAQIGQHSRTWPGKTQEHSQHNTTNPNGDRSNPSNFREKISPNQKVVTFSIIQWNCIFFIFKNQKFSGPGYPRGEHFHPMKFQDFYFKIFKIMESWLPRGEMSVVFFFEREQSSMGVTRRTHVAVERRTCSYSRWSKTQKCNTKRKKMSDVFCDIGGSMCGRNFGWYFSHPGCECATRSTNFFFRLFWRKK